MMIMLHCSKFITRASTFRNDERNFARSHAILQAQAEEIVGEQARGWIGLYPPISPLELPDLQISLSKRMPLVLARNHPPFVSDPN